MQAAISQFKRYLQRRYSHSSTAKHYLSDLSIFARTVGSKAPATVTLADIDDFIDAQLRAGLSTATINRRLASLHSFFEYLAGETPPHPHPNPVIWRRHGLRTGNHLPRDMSDNDVTRLFATITDPRDEAMFGLMVGAGLRVGEVSNLCLAHILPPTKPTELARLRVLGKGNKERIVWCVPALWATLETWIALRPAVENDYVFLNHRQKPITVSGIQYRLKQYCQTASITLTCHQLRHTFARRLVENGLPVDSLARLLGHHQLETTQRYINGADPSLRADFMTAMERLNATMPVDGSLLLPENVEDETVSPKPSTLPLIAPHAELLKIRSGLSVLPAWLAASVDAYLVWRWSSWTPHRAYVNGLAMLNGIKRWWTWVEVNCTVTDWSTFRRLDLERWLDARQQAAVSQDTIRAELSLLRTLLHFLEAHDYPIDPSLFRVQLADDHRQKLPRHLSEEDYRHLEQVVMTNTQDDTFHHCFDRACFLMLAHTGVRISELVNLRLRDVDLVMGRAVIRDGKWGRDRVVYLTPPLNQALQRYLQHRSPTLVDDFVFVLRKCPPAGRTIRAHLHHYAQQVGVSVTPHQLRHTFATRLLNEGMPIKSLQQLLGHKYLSSTQLYAQVYDETLYNQFRDAISRLEAIPVENWPLFTPTEHFETLSELDNSM